MCRKTSQLGAYIELVFCPCKWWAIRKLKPYYSELLVKLRRRFIIEAVHMKKVKRARVLCSWAHKKDPRTCKTRFTKAVRDRAKSWYHLPFPVRQTGCMHVHYTFIGSFTFLNNWNFKLFSMIFFYSCESICFAWFFSADTRDGFTSCHTLVIIIVINEFSTWIFRVIATEKNK